MGTWAAWDYSAHSPSLPGLCGLLSVFSWRYSFGRKSIRSNYSKIISNGYMPIPHMPCRVPAFWLPKSMSVVPEGGRSWNISRLGIRTEDEQSKVPLVLSLKIVGMPDLAWLIFGAKPPLARSSMTCLPSMIETLLTEIFSSLFAFFEDEETAQPTRARLMNIETITNNLFPFINLKIKNRRNKADDD